MKKKIISDSISNINSKYIEKAADYTVKRKRKKSTWAKWGSIAACFCICAMIAIGVWNTDTSNNNPQFPTVTESMGNQGNLSNNQGEYNPPVNSFDEIRLSAFAVSPGNPNSDSFGIDELAHVDVILQGNRLYEQILEEEYSSFGIGQVLKKTDFGTSLGVVTELAPNDAPLTTPCSQEPTLSGCQVYLYSPVECEAMIIVQGNGHCNLFRFVQFTEEGHSFNEKYQIFGASTSDDIAYIDYYVSKPNGGTFDVGDKKSITASEHLQAFFDITTNLQPFARESALSGDPEWLIKAREEYYNSNENNRMEINATIVLKNGLSIELSYQPTLGTGYIPGHYFLSEENNNVMKKIFCQ